MTLKLVIQLRKAFLGAAAKGRFQCGGICTQCPELHFDGIFPPPPHSRCNYCCFLVSHIILKSLPPRCRKNDRSALPQHLIGMKSMNPHPRGSNTSQNVGAHWDSIPASSSQAIVIMLAKSDRTAADLHKKLRAILRTARRGMLDLQSCGLKFLD